MSTLDSTRAVQQRAKHLRLQKNDYNDLLDAVTSQTKFVLIGEATHGSREFYRERIKITKRLIEEKNFNAVAIEADWPDAFRVHRYATMQSDDLSADEALSGFERFPTWLWRNLPVEEFIEWLRLYNSDCKDETTRTGFFGLDLYSLHHSIAAVIEFLSKTDPEAAQRARERYSCFDRFGQDVAEYARRVAFNLTESCREAVIAQLQELTLRRLTSATEGTLTALEALFCAQQNAHLVKNAEAYYRTAFGSHAESWNLRDRHMFETLEEIANHMNFLGREPRIVVWEHNSHIGDARATEMSQRGELNLGQLLRQTHGAATLNIGLTTFHGNVTAASHWGGPLEYKTVMPALEDSVENLFHEAGRGRNFLLDLRPPQVAAAFKNPSLERAIGVVYMPRTERLSHYFFTELASQFDFVIHWDYTTAVEPLEKWQPFSEEPAETYPSGF